MAGSVMLNCKVLLGGLDLSGQHSSLQLEYGAEMLDVTVFQAGVGTATRLMKPGLKTFSFNGDIFWDDVTDLVLFNRIAATREVMSFAPVGETEGDRTFFTRGVNATYNPASGEVGQLLKANMVGQNSNQALVRGQLMKRGSVTGASSNTTGINMGAVVAGQRIYSALHVLSPTTSGAPSLTAIIESDDSAGFTTPTTRLTHSAFTVNGADWQEAAGPFTDAYWRAKYTISGGGTFTVFHSFGIL